MFDIGWSELLILGVVTLIFVGPKELPVLMRTIGRYAGMLRRQANEFKAQFEGAMREMELEEMRKEMEAMQASVNTEVMRASKTLSEAGNAPAQSALGENPTQDALVKEASSPATVATDVPPQPAPPGKEA
jgi:sec-independent protein translocase protein TatB